MLINLSQVATEDAQVDQAEPREDEVNEEQVARTPCTASKRKSRLSNMTPAKAATPATTKSSPAATPTKSVKDDTVTESTEDDVPAPSEIVDTTCINMHAVSAALAANSNTTPGEWNWTHNKVRHDQILSAHFGL